VFDAFDNSTLDARTSRVVTKGDFWSATRTITPVPGEDPDVDDEITGQSPSAFIASDDEPVAMGGIAWQAWVSNWLERGRVPNKANVLGGLVDTMTDWGYTWCDACEVLAAHHTATPQWARMSDTLGFRTFEIRNARWQACRKNKTLRNLLPERPEEYGNINLDCEACPPRYAVSAFIGMCVPCAADEISRGNTCVKCEEGQVPTGSNECSGCLGNMYARDGKCVGCPVATTPNDERTACLPCAMDATIDWDASLPASACSASFDVSINPASSTTDNCPSEFWVEVVNIPQLLSRQFNEITVSTRPSNASLLMESTCSEAESEVGAWGEVSSNGSSVKRWLGSEDEGGTWLTDSTCDATELCDAAWCDSTAEMLVVLDEPAGMSRLLIRAEASYGDVANGVFSAHGNSQAAACVAPPK
jgi:hypothetical protein